MKEAKEYREFTQTKDKNGNIRRLTRRLYQLTKGKIGVVKVWDGPHVGFHVISGDGEYVKVPVYSWDEFEKALAMAERETNGGQENTQ